MLALYVIHALGGFYAPAPVVLSPGVAEYPGFTQERAVLATFGNAARTYHVGSYTVLVWNRNLLSKLS